MTISRRTVLLSAGGLGLMTPGTAFARAAADVQGSLTAQEASVLIDDYLTRLSGFGYSGATLLARGDEVLVRGGYGLANEADGIPVAADTVFDIGSMAKSFTAAAMLLLVERGRVRLDDPISRHLSNVPEDKQAITIEQLLSHTSGLESEFPFENPTAADYEEVTREEAIDRIMSTDLIHAPGAVFDYSNIGYILAAAIVETAGGSPFREFMRTEIFAPLGMASTGFWGEALPPVADSRLARGYADGREAYTLRSRSSATWCDLGGGEMVSTVDDLHAFLRAMRRDRLLPAALRERMWTPVKGEYGLGWMIEADGPGGRRIHHGGDTIAFGAELAWYPDQDLVLVNLTNRTYQILGTRYAADRVIPVLMLGQTPRMWPNQPFDVPPRWSPGGETMLEGLAGTYRLGTGAELVVSRGAEGGYRIAARGQAAIDAILPADEAERALRAASNARALALVQAAVDGDMETMTATLRLGAPVEGYRDGLLQTVRQDNLGLLRSIEAVGTAPFGFPVGSRTTVLKLSFEQGEDLLRFTWDRKQDRIINMGLGSRSLGATALRPSRDGNIIVGWNIVTGRSVFIDTSRLQGPEGRVEVRTSDGSRTFATRLESA